MTADISLFSEHNRRIAVVYNLAAEGYDKPAVRFFQLAAAQLVARAHLTDGLSVLDAATGTGAAAFVAAHKVGLAGYVLGVDIATGMLARARRTLAEKQLTNITLQYGDGARLDFADGQFDRVLCASGIFLLPDMLAALTDWQRMTRAGGRVALSCFGERAFQPLLDLYEARLRSFRVSLGAPWHPLAWRRLTDPEQCHQLLRAAGFNRIEVCVEQLGYDLKTADEWWDVVWHSSLRGPLLQLEPAQIARFKREHLAEVSALATPKGLWLDVPAVLAVGQKA